MERFTPGPTDRIVGTPPEFEFEHRGGYRILRPRGVETGALLQALLPDPERLLRSGEFVRRHETVHAAKVVIDGQAYFLKSFRSRGRRYAFRNAFRRSRAFRNVLAGWKLLARGLPVPKPLVALEERSARLLGSSYVLFEFVPGERLPAVWGRLKNEQRTALLSEIARLLGKWHARGAVHGDLKWSNFLVRAEDGRFDIWLSDLDFARVHMSPQRRRGRRDLDRFLRDLEGAESGTGRGRAFVEAWETALRLDTAVRRPAD